MTERISEVAMQAEPIEPERIAVTSGVFDISDADGVNESERLLTKLCRQSFLSLWSFANLHTDQDMHGGKGSAKEFADVLVVFGNDVVIFSDKHIVFQQDKGVDVAWRRWYDRAIVSSAKQLHGAMNWARRFPGRVFIDSKCQRALPVEIPDASRARYHLVAVTRGSKDACIRYFRGGSGSLVICTEIVGRGHADTPFTVGIVTPDKEFVHVFDEYSLEVVLEELDTTRDFIDYLCDRKAFLAHSGTVVAPGEEQLLAAYLQNANENGRRFLPVGTRRPDVVMFDDSFHDELLKRPEYIGRKRLERVSYAWDDLIERFIRIGSPELVAPAGHVQLNEDTESALRIMASESRFRRRILMEALRGVFENARHSGRLSARILATKEDPHIAYVMLIVPKLNEKTYEEYRRFRISILHAYTSCAKLKCPDVITFVGLAFDHPNKDYTGSSEDLCVVSYPAFKAENRIELERRREELGIWHTDAPVMHVQADEYPENAAGSTPIRDKNKGGRGSKRDRERSRAKVAKASRKRNRSQ